MLRGLEGEMTRFVRKEFEAYLRCGRLEHGFLRVKCIRCRHEHLVAFSCRRRGFCPSCGARRMVESAAHLVDYVLPRVPIRQWVVSFPWPLRLGVRLAARVADPRPGDCDSRLVQCRHTTSGPGSWSGRPDGHRRLHLTAMDGRSRTSMCFAAPAHPCTMAGMQKDCRNNPCQRYGSALNLNVHLHLLVPDGAYTVEHDKPHFRRAPAPSPTELHELLNTLIARITRTLVRGGVLIEEPEHPYLDLELNSPLEQLSAAAVRYHIAVGPLAGRKTMTLRNPGAQLHGCRS
ncbi:MAG: hypothetical protein E4H01_03190 [Lysobacterales bacterium]|nr:MAG: hypothetical protein E4H01_03190 [Xanthomonadales bacterium]